MHCPNLEAEQTLLTELKITAATSYAMCRKKIESRKRK